MLRWFSRFESEGSLRRLTLSLSCSWQLRSAVLDLYTSRVAVFVGRCTAIACLPPGHINIPLIVRPGINLERWNVYRCLRQEFCMFFFLRTLRIYYPCTCDPCCGISGRQSIVDYSRVRMTDSNASICNVVPTQIRTAFISDPMKSKSIQKKKNIENSQWSCIHRPQIALWLPCRFALGCRTWKSFDMDKSVRTE